jgi:cytoskeletal protein RodZ
VFEIGNSLREARMRRGVEFAQAEVATKIRGKYLRALEEEHFDVLPAETYVKGFLRTYAEYLGLDGQLYVDEFNSRFVQGEATEARPRRVPARPTPRGRRMETSVVVVALGAIAVLMVIVISAWTGSKKPQAKPHATTTATRPHAVPALLTVKALRGSTHVTARNASAVGTIRYDGTVQAGDSAVGIRGTRLWVQIDSPENLHIEVRGHTVHVPGLKPRVILVTATGWRPL